MSEIKGIISEIERYAVNDGPGIRTVVFLKGCPLRCLWCANPETQKVAKQVMYWQTRCIGCRQCLKACQNGALSFGEAGVEIDRQRCLACGGCVGACNSDALTMAGEEKTVSEVMEVVLRDRMFYETSGGGVTFSGGEATAQKEFLLALAKAAKANGIGTCIETCGEAPWSTYEALLPVMDKFLFDIKIFDEETHKKYIGASNKLILQNFEGLIKAGADVVVRIPIIPGVNNTEENINGTIGFLKRVAPGNAVSLLPYHRLGASKYQKLSMDYALPELLPPSPEEMNRIAEIFRENGFPVTIGE